MFLVGDTLKLPIVWSSWNGHRLTYSVPFFFSSMKSLITSTMLAASLIFSIVCWSMWPMSFTVFVVLLRLYQVRDIYACTCAYVCALARVRTHPTPDTPLWGYRGVGGEDETGKWNEFYSFSLLFSGGANGNCSDWSFGICFFKPL